jgi:hypothetical protein
VVAGGRDDEIAESYQASVHAASAAGISVEPEAQLSEPVPSLLRAVAEDHDIGAAVFLAETQLPGVRPDFGVLINERFRGWLELKQPGTGVDPTSWTGAHNRGQWEELKKLDNLLVCDGQVIQHFSGGESEGPAVALPYEKGDWTSEELAGVLRRFSERLPRPIRTASELAQALAPLARDLRLRISAGLDPATPDQAISQARRIWGDLLNETVDDEQFADALAQVTAYSLVIATLDGEGDLDGDGQVSIEEAEESLKNSHRVLAATLQPVLDVEGLRDSLRTEIGALERLLGAVDAEAIAERQDPRGDPWLWFYEDFLETYDQALRAKAGVYYTPVPVVDCIVRLVEHVLTERFDIPLGFGDERVVTLDPAVGTGTFPLTVIDHAAERAEQLRGSAGPSQVAKSLAERLFGFELLPGPFAVAHLRVGERLRELGADLGDGGAQILLADTLDSPTDDSHSSTPALFGATQVLSDERRRAKEVKRTQEVMAVIGNPPYDRIRREDGGGWVVHGDGDSDSAIFNDILEMANTRTVFSHVASLYNLYAYFWRWAIWKAFEQHGDGPAVVGFITASSWLDAPGFVGLRELTKGLCDEVWIVDLGGDNRGSTPEENVFNIETPVAIAVLIREGQSNHESSARIHYRRLRGNRAEKLTALDEVRPPSLDPASWVEISNEQWAPFAPSTGDATWDSFPALRDLMPWQQPGVMMNRTWPVAPDPATLNERWRAFLEDSAVERRAELFPNPRSGRTITTQVGDLPKLADLPSDAHPQPIVRHGWRAFDRQWTFRDPRLSKTESPSLWQSLSSYQIFLVSLEVIPVGAGPCLIPSTGVPDKHFFRGSYGGKDVIPLYRDDRASEPNITRQLLEKLETALGLDARPTPEDLASYIYAVLSTPAYQSRFESQLEDKTVRIPVTSDRECWADATELGAHLLWLNTFGERMRDPEKGRDSHIPMVQGLEWTEAVTSLPVGANDIAYDPTERQIRIGDGLVSGVDPEVWDFQVSGWPVVKRWLEHRTESGRGRQRSELDGIRPTEWQDAWNDELLDLLRVLTLTNAKREEQDALLERICNGPLITAEDLPVPTESEREVPDTIAPSSQQPMTFDDL